MTAQAQIDAARRLLEREGYLVAKLPKSSPLLTWWSRRST